jgi:hypothetical protein
MSHGINMILLHGNNNFKTPDDNKLHSLFITIMNEILYLSLIGHAEMLN